MSVLKSLYYGALTPADRAYTQEKSAKMFQELLKTQAEIGEKLLAYKDEQVPTWFQAYCELQTQVDLAEQEEMFLYAFRLGARWHQEVFSPRNSILQEDF